MKYICSGITDAFWAELTVWVLANGKPVKLINLYR